MVKPAGREMAMFAVTAVVAALTMLALGWRDTAGIIGVSIGAGLTVAFVSRTPPQHRGD